MLTNKNDFIPFNFQPSFYLKKKKKTLKSILVYTNDSWWAVYDLSKCQERVAILLAKIMNTTLE